MNKDDKGGLFSEALTLAFNTSAGAYPVPLPGIGKVPMMSVNEAMDKINKAVQEGVNAKISLIKSDYQNAIQQQAIAFNAQINSAKVWVGMVSIDELKTKHSGCVSNDYSTQLAQCTSAAQNWCRAKNKIYQIGLIQQWPKDQLEVACLQGNTK